MQIVTKVMLSIVTKNTLYDMRKKRTGHTRALFHCKILYILSACPPRTYIRERVVMLTGKVKWFNNAKGYGFILADTGGDDLFVHYSSIQMQGYKTLKAGQLVSFETTPGEKGLHAINIHPLQQDGSEAALTPSAVPPSSISPMEALPLTEASSRDRMEDREASPEAV